MKREKEKKKERERKKKKGKNRAKRARVIRVIWPESAAGYGRCGKALVNK